MTETVTLLTIDRFAPLTNDSFSIDYNREKPPLVVELVEVNPVDTGEEGQERRPFSLILQSDTTDYLEQATYRFTHATLGTLDLFLVPIGSNKTGMQYEVMFT